MMDTPSPTPSPDLVYVITAKRTSHQFKVGTRVVWDHENQQYIDSLHDTVTNRSFPAAVFKPLDGHQSWWVAWEIECVPEITLPDITNLNDIEAFLEG
jgi:hypothetical protein